MAKMVEADFGGYATKANLKCSDGRVILPNAFQHQDKMTLPLVWAHGHSGPENVLGHVLLENRNDGVYVYGYFNDTKQGQDAKKLVQHRDIDSLSIWANQLVEKLSQVVHGMIREVSLVISGANPGAKIDFVQVQHGDGDVENLVDEAVIYTGLLLENVDKTVMAHTDSEKTVQDIYDSLSPEQQEVVNFMIGAALEAGGATEHSEKPDEDDNTDKDGEVVHKEGTEDVTQTHNVFEQGNKTSRERHVLSHDALRGIAADAVKRGSLKDAVHAYAEEHLEHGINDIDLLFPDTRTLQARPEFIKRRTEWVAGVLASANHSPFSRVKTILADLTQDEARAKGYVKGEYKKEQWFGLTRRVTTPTTIYKKQRLDRDDIIDITDFEVVAWMKEEIRFMLEEELARAMLISDGREVDDEDKIKDPAGESSGDGIRSILNDNELFATKVYVNIGDSESSYYEVFESILRSRKFYKGSGRPKFYTTNQVVVEMLLSKDENGRRYWMSVAELASDLMVSEIVEVEVMEDEPDLLGIIVNLADYNIGADKGGELNFFDDFDIDYNQLKYLMETRLSGALTKYKAALVIMKTEAGNTLVNPITSPTFVSATGVVTIPLQTGVVYKNADTSATLSAGAQTALAAGATLNVKAFPATNYYFATNAEDEWSFTRPSS